MTNPAPPPFHRGERYPGGDFVEMRYVQGSLREDENVDIELRARLQSQEQEIAVLQAQQRLLLLLLLIPPLLLMLVKSSSSSPFFY